MSTTPAAIVSIGALFPGAPTTQDFWRDLVEGRDRLSDVPRTHWLASDYFDPRPGAPDKVYTTRGGFLPAVEFSPLEFGLPPATLPAVDTAQLLGLVVAKRVLAEATRGRYESMDRSRISVLLGVASATELVAHMAGRLQIPVVEAALRAAGVAEDEALRVRAGLEACYVPWQEGTFPGLLANVVAGRIANRFDLGGTNAVLDAACAGALAAVEMAVQELSLGVADLVITGGVDTLNDILMFMCFAQTGALSRSGDCRPFSQDADGTLLGEVLGLFALKRLADAERDGDPVYAVIRGLGTSSDGRATSIYAPLAAGQARALERAYAAAGVSPSTVGLVEAHGTGTVAGDAAEVDALRRVYQAAGAKPKQAAIGSVKGQIGHTKAAAGAAGLAKAALALHHKVLPPTLKVRAPLPALAEPASPLYANTAARPWIHGAPHPRRAAVSALGFGGTNFHLVLEEHTGAARPPRLRALPAELVLLGAADRAALAGRCRAESQALQGARPGALAHVARRAQLAFDAASPARLALVAASEEALANLLARAARTLGDGGDFRDPALRACSFGEGAAAGPVALLFPGQGSQSVGMGGDLALHFDAARALWDEAARLDEFADEGLHHRVFPPPAFTDEERAAQAERLTATDWAQPALACASLSMLRLCKAAGLEPIAVAGHSLGEVTALAAAGALDPLDAVRVARTRGALMADASRACQGAMTAAAAELPRMESLLGEWRLPVAVANHNAPAQVVLSGETAAIAEVERRLAAEGIAAQRLAVATAFHSPIVEPACAPFRRALEAVALRPAQVPVYSNATAAPYPADPAAARDLLATALARPVRFAEQVEAMHAAGARTFVEVGPGRVLTKLVSRCLEGRAHLAVALGPPGQHGVTAFFQAMGQLSAAGVPLDFAPLWEGQALPDNPSRPASSKLTVRLTGANYGKPYPAAAEEALRRARPTAAPKEPTPVPLAPVDAPEPAEPARPAPKSADFLSALRELQAPLIAAQVEYEKAMAESHAAFLKAVESSYAALAGPAAAALPEPPGVPAISTPRATASLPPAAVMSAPPARGAVLAPAAVAPHATAAAPAPATPALPVELMPLLRSVVAELTGYPPDLVEPQMDLESDLGIDSIKRVEILSAVRRRAPNLPPIDPARLGKLRTLAEIVRALEPKPAAPPKPEAPQATRSDGPPPTAPRADPSPQPRHDAQLAPKLAESQAPLSRLAVVSEPSAAVGLAAPGLFGAGAIAVLPDDAGVAPALAKALRARGVAAEVTARAPDGARGVVFLGGLRRVNGLEEALRINGEAFEAARDFAAKARAGGRLFVTVQDTGGDLGASGSSGDRAFLAGLGALAKTAAEEWPASCARAIDVACAGREPEAVAEAIAQELLLGGSQREVGLAADGARTALCEVLAPRAEGGERLLREGDVVLVSGGARGVTAQCAVALAAAMRPRLVLLGRTALAPEPPAYERASSDADLKRIAVEEARRRGAPVAPRDIAREVAQIASAREVRGTLARLAKLGVQARYETVDVRDAAALAALVADVRKRWAPVRGLVHGAGVVADALLENRQDRAGLDRVLDTKVRGLTALLAATAAEPLSWICLFSSAAARGGNAGQADYAMANEILNKVAAVEARRRPGARVVSLGWGPWQGGMVTPALARHFTSRGIELIAPTAGADAFARECEAPPASTSPAPAELVLCAARLSPAPAPIRGEVRLDAAALPFLGDHRVRGTVMVPAALALEWLARVAATPSAARVALHDLRVRRGILLPRFGDAAELAHATAQEAAGKVALELQDATGAARYTARAEPAPSAVALPRPAAGGAGLEGPLYAPARLFHGPRFQVIDELEAVSPEGGRAALKGTLDMGWEGGPWRTDPAAVDGALQVAFLSNLAAGMGPTLPLAIARAVVGAPAPGPVACAVETRSRTAERAVFDAWLTREDGALVAELTGVEMFAAPSGTGEG